VCFSGLVVAISLLGEIDIVEVTITSDILFLLKKKVGNLL